MKIAILSLYSGRISRGVETWVLQMSQEFKTNGHQVNVINGKENSVSIFTVKNIYKLIAFRPDVVIPTNGGSQSLMVNILGKIFHWKTVITGHAGIGRDDKWNILIRPDCFVSPSLRGEKWAKNLWFSKGVKIAYIPHGVNLEKFNPNNKKIKLDLPRPIYLCVSSTEAYKRVNLAKEAVRKLKKGSLLIIGGDRKVAHEQMPAYYASADVFTLPSDSYEAFGLVYLEALASGLPVVATDDKLRREIIGKAGILVDPTDIDQYAKALEEAASKDWGNIPRRQAEKFSWQSVAKQYEDLFLKLI